MRWNLLHTVILFRTVTPAAPAPCGYSAGTFPVLLLKIPCSGVIHTHASDQKGSVQTRKASRQRQNCARNLECDSRGLTATVKICTRTQYVGLAEQCQRPLAGPAMNFGADLALAALKA